MWKMDSNQKSIPVVGFLTCNDCDVLRAKTGVYRRVTHRTIIPPTAHNNPPIFHHIISKLNWHFEMSYLGPAHFMLRIKITQDQKEGTVMLNQCQYITDMLDQYGMSNCHTCPTPMNP